MNRRVLLWNLHVYVVSSTDRVVIMVRRAFAVNMAPETLTFKNNLFQKCTVIIYSFRFCMISFCCVQWNHPTEKKKKSRWHFFSFFWTMKTRNTPLSLHYSVMSAPVRRPDRAGPLWRYSRQVYRCCRTISWEPDTQWMIGKAYAHEKCNHTHTYTCTHTHTRISIWDDTVTPE